MGFILGICSVKQVLSISDISKLRSRIKSDNIEDLYQIYQKLSKIIFIILLTSNKK